MSDYATHRGISIRKNWNIRFNCCWNTYISSTHCGLLTSYGNTDLVQVMAWCLTAPSHYLNQCWLLISGVLWNPSESNSIARAQAIILHELESYILKITVISTRGHCVITVYTKNKTPCLQNSVSWIMFVSMTISSCPWHVTHWYRSNEIGILGVQPHWI